MAFIVREIGDDIRKRDTNWRRAVDVTDRVLVYLSFVARGDKSGSSEPAESSEESEPSPSPSEPLPPSLPLCPLPLRKRLPLDARRGPIRCAESSLPVPSRPMPATPTRREAGSVRILNVM